MRGQNRSLRHGCDTRRTTLLVSSCTHLRDALTDTAAMNSKEKAVPKQKATMTPALTSTKKRFHVPFGGLRTVIAVLT
jgi:hypothetical protein